MKGLIAAGGHGSRLRPITNTINKHLIKLANKPLLFFAVEKLKEAGITEIAIVVNPGDYDIQAVLADGQQFGVNITYLEQTGGALGVAHVLKIAQDFIKGSDFVFYLGDNILLQDLSLLRSKFESQNLDSLLGFAKVPNPQAFGVPVIEGGRLIRIEEKPTNPATDYAVIGVYFYNKNVFKALETLKPSSRGELEISDVHTWLLQNNFKVGWQETTNYWKDTGKPSDLLVANNLILSQISPNIKGYLDPLVEITGSVYLGEGSRVEGKTKIRGPVVIGSNCLIKDSYLGPFTSISNQVTIDKSEISDSIVLDRVSIKVSKPIREAVLGEGAQIRSVASSQPHSAHHLIVGRDSIVEL